MDIQFLKGKNSKKKRLGGASGQDAMMGA